MKRNANGNGSVRKISVARDGKTYTYWQARYSAGFDPGTGKQMQHSITGKTQKEVLQKKVLQKEIPVSKNHTCFFPFSSAYPPPVPCPAAQHFCSYSYCSPVPHSSNLLYHCMPAYLSIFLIYELFFSSPTLIMR